MSTTVEPTATSTPTASATAASPTPGTSVEPTSPTSPTSPASSSARPTTAPSSGQPTSKLFAVAFHALDPSSKNLKIRPAVTPSSPSSSNIIAHSPSTASSHSQEGVVEAFNAATDLVKFLDEQLQRPPSVVETLTGLFRPASAELEGRLKKMGERVRSGKVEIKGWDGERRVVRMEWEEFVKIFGKD